MVALYPKLLTSLTKTRRAKPGRKQHPGNNSAFAVWNNDRVIDVLPSGRQR